jgi:hypothetical protein
MSMAASLRLSWLGDGRSTRFIGCISYIIISVVPYAAASCIGNGGRYHGRIEGHEPYREADWRRGRSAQEARTLQKESGMTRKVLAALSGIAGLSAVAAGIVLFLMEAPLLSQPDHAVPPYTVAMHLKGVVRYVTPEQYLWNNVAYYLFFGGIAVAMLADYFSKKYSN